MGMSLHATRRQVLGGLAALACTGAAPASPRVLSLGGAVTETVYAIGAGPLLVGADDTSLYPPAAVKLTKVGYVRTLGAEGLLSLAPTVVLASADAGPPAALARLRDAGVQLLTLREAHTADAALARVHDIGKALGRVAEAAAVATALEADLAQMRADLDKIKNRPRVLFLLTAGRGAPMGAGRDTAADAMIALAGGVNAMADTRLYRPISAEAVLMAAPDLVVTTADTLAGVGGLPGLRALPGLAETPALRQGRVYDFDALYLLSFGPRLAHAIHDLAAVLHPGATLRSLPVRPWMQG
jgi:iron complex transport system substrate-binding protein